MPYFKRVFDLGRVSSELLFAHEHLWQFPQFSCYDEGGTGGLSENMPSPALRFFLQSSVCPMLWCTVFYGYRASLQYRCITVHNVQGCPYAHPLKEQDPFLEIHSKPHFDDFHIFQQCWALHKFAEFSKMKMMKGKAISRNLQTMQAFESCFQWQSD